MTAPVVVRVGDRERERTANQLSSALAQGYLGLDEYDTRLQAAFAAHTTEELAQLVGDLPLARLRRNDPRRQHARMRAARRGIQIHLAGYLAMCVIVLTVWLAVGLTAGAWYFWPIWPILGAGIGVLGHALPGLAMSSGHRGRVHRAIAAATCGAVGGRSSAHPT